MDLARSPQRSGDLDGRQGATQVVGHGLAKGNQASAALVDVDFHGVQALVAGDNGFSQSDVPFGHRFNAGRDLGFGQTAHAGNLGGQLSQFFIIGFDDVLVHGGLS